MTQKAVNKKINEIEYWVSRGQWQTASNCRILVNEIKRLRSLLKEE